MAFPFKQVPALLDIFPFVKPFRATGRFAWPFYFAAQAFAAVCTQKIYTQSASGGKKAIGIMAVLAFGLFNIIEGFYYHIDTGDSITKSHNLFRKEFLASPYLSALEQIDPADYQAIISLPFFHQGSETFSRPRQEETVRTSLILSYHTGIPLVCADLTRTSVEESKKIVQLMSPGFYHKDIEPDLTDEKPFLVVRTDDSLTDCETDIFKRCDPLFSDEKISLYTLPKDELFRDPSREIVQRYLSVKPGLYSFGAFELSADTTFFYYDSFEESPSDNPFRGNGGYRSAKAGKNILAEFSRGTFSPGKDYRLSIWMFNGMKDALNDWFRLIVEEYDEEKGKFYTTTCFPEQAEVINGDWSLVECSFRINDPKNRIFIVTKGKEGSEGPFFADDLLIREAGTDVYLLDNLGTRLFFNNHDISAKSVRKN